MRKKHLDARPARAAVWRFAMLAGLAGLLLAPAGIRPAKALAQDGGPSMPPPPATRVEPVTDDYSGTKIVDNYRWLEDQNSPETRAWIDKQNSYTDSMLDHLPDLDKLKTRLATLLKVDTVGMPFARGGRYFFSKRAAAEDQAVLYFREGRQGADQVLLDANTLTPDHSSSAYFADVSNDGKLVVYAVRKGGEDETSLHLLDVDTRKELTDEMPRARYSSISLTPDNAGFYYAKVNDQGDRIYYHKIGSDPSSDPLVFGDKYDVNPLMGCAVSEDGEYLLIQVDFGAAATRSEVWAQDLAKKGPIEPIIKGIDARFDPDIARDHLYVVTNWKAPNGRVLSIDLKNSAQVNWKEIIPENPNAALQNISLVGGEIAASYTHNASSEVKLFDANGKFVRDLVLPAIGSTGGLSGRWSSPEAFYSFNTFTIPTTIYRYDVAKGVQEVWHRSQIPFESDKYEVHQVWYASKDGTKVPMFVVHAKGTKLDGSHPALLTGYGGFNLPELPSFSTRGAAWVEAGGVYALANLRGGSEFGEKWHAAGMLANKQHVFDDFIAAGEYLVKSGYTSKARLAIIGGSNGGLLVGAALTQRPDLFRAVICDYPLLDMLRYQKFLVARWWVPEYGSADSADQFKYIYAYSPYQHVKRGQKYPAVLLQTGDADTRVAPLHARKMTALLQADAAPGRPILLHYDTHAGHSGGEPIAKQVDDMARELAFLDWQLNEPIR